MVMEVGQGIAGSRWTSNSPRPFRRAPGGALASTRWTSTVPHPFAPAPGGGMGYISGFHAAPANEEITVDPLLVLGRGPFTVKKEPFVSGQTPSMVVRFVFTDRGRANKSVLDAQVRELMRKAGYKTSKVTSFKSEPVTWRWQQDKGGTFYMAVVQTPKKWAGMRYAGQALGVGPVYEPDAALLGKLPTQLWVYTVALTTAYDTMSDADGAQTITLLKQAMVNMANAGVGSYAHVIATVRSCPSEVFGKVIKPVAKASVAKTGSAALLLLFAYNLLSPHIGSERI